MNAVIRPRLMTVVQDWLRRAMSISIRMRSDTAFAFTISFVWLTLYNFSFWERTIAAMWRPNVASMGFLASVFVLVWWVQALPLLLMPTRRLMRIAASILFVIASLSSYFTQAYGALMNKDMLRNALQTDPAEASALLTPHLFAYLLLLGVLPALLVWKVELPRIKWTKQLAQRAYVAIGVLLICATGVLSFSAEYAVYLRAHKPIRFALSPLASLSSTIGLLTQARGTEARGTIDPGGAAYRTSEPQPKPLLVVLVVGETARAANFQLGGYSRPTTPGLAEREVVYFSQAVACGTSTAISVPCMFSHLPREQFDVDEASRYTNVLDSLSDAGMDVEWHDNNAGCKGVCARVSTTKYAQRADDALCGQPYCYDEIMLEDLESRTRSISRDTVLIFHQIGSHGPAYYQRYPEGFERFKPACRSNELQHCSEQEIINAYDNTIAYTDFVLSKQIDILRAHADTVDSVLIYASDHGESLGEQGVYLHGMPYAFAPRVQKEVPMLVWLSDGYSRRVKINRECLIARAREPASHDVIYHTLLGAAQTRDRAYDRRLDLISACSEVIS